MKLKCKFPILFSALACTLVAGKVMAQDQKPADPAKGVVAEEIEVVRPYKPLLANAFKIRRNPDLNDTPPFKPNLSYTILDKKLELNTDIRTLQYQQLATAAPALLQNNYVKIGGGNQNTSFGELYLNSGGDEALQAGFYAKHLAQKGELNKQQFSNQEIGVFGKSIGNSVTLSGDAGYKHLGTYFYGNDPQALLNTTNPEKQQLHLIKLKGELAKRFNNNPEEWTYAFQVNAALFKNQLKASENSVVLSASGSKSKGLFNYGLNTAIDFTNVKDQAYAIGNHILRANPYVKYQVEGFNLNVGLNLVQQFGELSTFSPLPAVDLETSISPGYATFFAGVNGDVKKTSLNEYSFQNPYLGQNISIKNSTEKSNIYAGIKGNMGSSFGFKLLAYFKRVDQLPLFVNNSSNVSHFELIYDNGISQLSGLNAEVEVKASDLFNLNLKLESTNYKLSSEAKAWFKPGIRLETQARAKVNERLDLNASFVYNGETFAINYVTQTFNIPPDIEIKSMKSFMDLNIGGTYQIKKQWGAYLQANNILGTAYQQYLYYPNLGLNIFGGIHYSF